MKRVTQVTLFYLLIAIESNSQVYFNKRVDFYNQNQGAISFIMVDDTFYIPINLLDTHEGVIGKITQLGTTIFTNKYTANFNISYYYPYSIINYKHSLYTTGGGGYYSNISTPLYKYKHNGDTLQTHYYGDTAYYQPMQKIIPYYKTNNKLLLIGTTDSICGPGHKGTYKPIIRVVDTNGVLYQTKVYLGSCAYRNIYGVDTTENKGYLISYAGWYSTWQTATNVMKLDSNLNLVWDRQIDITSSAEPDLVNVKNNHYMVVSNTVDSVWNFTYKWQTVSLTKLNLNGTIAWQKHYGKHQQVVGSTGIKQCANGDLIICGTLAAKQLVGWLMRTDSAGNLKWWKDYTAKTLPVQDTISENYLYDVLELPNGDIAAVGWCGGSSINPLQQTWLLKVDSNGCFGIGNCPTNITTGINDIGALSKADAQITAYPNPFKDELNINYSILGFEGTAQLQLIELTSCRVIDSIELTQSFGTKQFNTQNIANGLYVLSLKQNNKPSVNFKIINIR